MKIFCIVLSIIVAFIGCASTGVVPADRGTFMVSKQSAAGIFGTPDGVRADIYAEANEFCMRTGEAVETVNIEVKDAIPYVRTGSARLQFKCIQNSVTTHEQNQAANSENLLTSSTVDKNVMLDNEVRTALLIGNAKYPSNSLATPVNDVREMQAILKKLSFDTILVENASRKNMVTAMETFSKKIQARGGVALMFYAGHGMQIKGKNFLIPTDANIESEISGSSDAVDLDIMVDIMSTSNSRVNVIILDACRNNPFERRFRGAGRGLAPMNAGDARGMLIAYSTAPGKTASDGEGQHSPYAQALSNVLSSPNLTIEQVFKKVRQQVEAATNGTQTPWETSSLTGELILH